MVGEGKKRNRVWWSIEKKYVCIQTDYFFGHYKKLFLSRKTSYFSLYDANASIYLVSYKNYRKKWMCVDISFSIFTTNSAHCESMLL